MLTDKWIDKIKIDDFIQLALIAYKHSILMTYANTTTKKRLLQFMSQDFFPVWRKNILFYLSEKKLKKVRESVLIEHLHESLYSDKLFSYQEHRLFMENDPDGYQRYISKAVPSGFTFYRLE